MLDFKPWYQSRTIWAALVSVSATAANLVGIDAGSQEIDAATESVLQLVSGVAGVVAVFGRLSAKTRIF